MILPKASLVHEGVYCGLSASPRWLGQLEPWSRAPQGWQPVLASWEQLRVNLEVVLHRSICRVYPSPSVLFLADVVLLVLLYIFCFVAGSFCFQFALGLLWAAFEVCLRWWLWDPWGCPCFSITLLLECSDLFSLSLPRPPVFIWWSHDGSHRTTVPSCCCWSLVFHLLTQVETFLFLSSGQSWWQAGHFNIVVRPPSQFCLRVF